MGVKLTGEGAKLVLGADTLGAAGLGMKAGTREVGPELGAAEMGALLGVARGALYVHEAMSRQKSGFQLCVPKELKHCTSLLSLCLHCYGSSPGIVNAHSHSNQNYMRRDFRGFSYAGCGLMATAGPEGEGSAFIFASPPAFSDMTILMLGAFCLSARGKLFSTQYDYTANYMPKSSSMV